MNKLLIVILAFTLSVTVKAADGMINIKSDLTVATTADKLIKVLNNKGMTIFNRVKHSEAAEKVGINLRKTELIIFGNPKVGSLLMKCQQSMAIDLPLKALIWKDESNNVWLSYNDIKFLASRHQISNCKKEVNKVENALNKIMSSVVTKTNNK